MSRTKKPTKFDYDLIVIGSGSGGGVAAHIAVSKGKKVAVVEEDKVGGECPNYGCVPTKALLQAAEAYHTTVERGKEFGLKASNVSFNWQAIKRYKDKAVERTGTSHGKETFAKMGISLLKGRAHFISPHEISTGKKRYTARRFLIATGTKDVTPPIEGLEKVGYITYKGAATLPKLPKSLFVIGGGAIGTEFTQLFNTLDVKVTQADIAPRLLPHEEPETSEFVQEIFKQNGITVLIDTKVVKVEKSQSKKLVTYVKDGKVGTKLVDEVMVAAGKSPNVDLGLVNAGVEFDKHGIKTNDMMQTKAKHIYAAGDVVGPYAFTHMAAYQSKIAAHNMFSRRKVIAKYHAVPRCTFLRPEVASVGMTEEEANVRGIKIKVNSVPISIIGRSNTSNEQDGFVKVITSKTNVVIGGTVVAPRGGEMMHELAIAVQNGLKAEDIAATIHAYPTWSEAVRIACAGIK